LSLNISQSIPSRTAGKTTPPIPSYLSKHFDRDKSSTAIPKSIKNILKNLEKKLGIFIREQ